MSSTNTPKQSYRKTVIVLGLIVLFVIAMKSLPDANAGPGGGNSTVCPLLRQAESPAPLADSIYRRWVAAGESAHQAAVDMQNSVNEYCPDMWSQLGEADWEGGLVGWAR